MIADRGHAQQVSSEQVMFKLWRRFCYEKFSKNQILSSSKVIKKIDKTQL
jgi:hypothetical protein